VREGSVIPAKNHHRFDRKTGVLRPSLTKSNFSLYSLSNVDKVNNDTAQEVNRLQASLLAPLEKKCLIWLARRIPTWVNPDHLTIVGLAGLLGFGLSFWLTRYNKLGLVLAIVFLAVNWFGDSLDGTLARVRNKERIRYGFYVDHIVDAIGSLFLFAGLAFSPFITGQIAICLFITYLLLSIEVYITTCTLGIFHLSVFKLGPTELRIILAVLTMTIFFYPVIRIGGVRILLLDLFGIIIIAIMGVGLVVSVIKHTLFLYRSDRIL
jgi:phosphatidylglycerophosphate synthase